MTRRRSQPPVNLAVLVAVEVGALIFLRRVGGSTMRVNWNHLATWSRSTAPEDAVAAAFRVLSLAGAYWLLATTVLYLLGRAGRMRSVVRGIGWATAPGVRKLVDAAVAASIVGGTVVGGGAVAHGASGHPPTSPPLVIQVGIQPAQASGVEVNLGDGHAYVPVPAGDPSHAQQTARRTPSTASNSATTSTTETTSAPSAPSPSVQQFSSTGATLAAASDRGSNPAWMDAGTRSNAVRESCVVKHGDNLWVIAAEHLATNTGRPLVRLGRGEIARYWMKVVQANRHKLPSGNPSLIHPGELVMLPAIDS